MLNTPEPSVDDKPTSVAETLRRAKALIDTPEKWTKGAFARKRKGGPEVTVRNPDATRFCMLGALLRLDGPHEYDAVVLLREAIGSRRAHIPYFNDSSHRTHEQVMAAFDKAIALAEGTPQ